ncbi:hypothetical protein AB3456_14660 (plasmid) [Staphylococcus pseudoxylosus]|uniref:hypothetical protein n=1 Tax=Staphylococcus TaxID=1279 RepID=UPI000E6A8AC8|nr:hypothetical protein [Staphylococcus xylosus]RIM75599.1 hypothetical protein BU116_12830 [Staphylococcus xylosus]
MKLYKFSENNEIIIATTEKRDFLNKVGEALEFDLLTLVEVLFNNKEDVTIPLKLVFDLRNGDLDDLMVIAKKMNFDIEISEI